VNAKAQSMHVNYTQLLSSSTVCPVREEFKVTALPTLVLVDQSGEILWRYVGEPDRYTWGELERRIQSKLNARW
jgi:hypothetical protein